VVLVKIGELVVEEDRVFELDGDVEFDDALAFIRDISDGGIVRVVNESIAGGLDVSLLVSGTETIRELVRWEGNEIGRVDRGRSEFLAFGVVKSHFGDKGRAPNEETANGCEDDANNEESWEDGLWGKDRLPCLETLLLEGSVCRTSPAALFLCFV